MRTRLLLLAGLAGCATTIAGHERGLFYSASGGMSHSAVGPGWYWHLPWNHYVIYDLRWQSHVEEVHIHSKDGLHLNLDVSVVVRPKPSELYDLDLEGGPSYYDHLVKPAVYGATRDATSKFEHLEIATKTHDVETAIRDALLEHLKGTHLEVAEVAIQHFDLPPEVEQAANRKAASGQLLAAKDVDLQLAKSDAEIAKAQKQGQIEAEGLERKLKQQQELEQTQRQIEIEQVKRKADLEKVQAEAEATRLRAQGEADAVRIKAEGEKARIAAMSGGSPSYVRLQALDALARAMSGPNTKVLLFPFGKDGLPSFFSPFLNPYQAALGGAADGGTH